MEQAHFWQHMDQLLAALELVIDRPRGSRHPRYPNLIYPLDYGYLQGTQAMDMGGIDVWSGSQPEEGVTGLVCTVDLLKRDTELKILLGCTAQEAQVILNFHNSGPQSAILIWRQGA